MKFLRTILLMLTLLPLTACAISGDPLDGKVLDESTNKPVPGAIVVLRWQGNNWGALVHSQGVCYHVETAITDENGQYRTPEWSDASSGFFINNRYITKTAYKPGYVFGTKPTEEKIVWMVPFKGSREERFDYLDRVVSNSNCGTKDSYKNLYRIWYAVSEEALAIAHTAEEKKRAESFKEVARDALINRNKPTTYDERGRLINANPSDSFRPEDLR